MPICLRYKDYTPDDLLLHPLFFLPPSLSFSSHAFFSLPPVFSSHQGSSLSRF
ncbi:rCG59199 [Rattus norvegicus]|uniref:RCG59199 n=1 Tax=Rattus norvegicus TaxID=10116 RepID=A6KIT9_RAT|nr:rCG59199 [Rattus norvegicus]